MNESRPAAPVIRLEEALHLDYCPRRRRPLWEAATFTLQAVVAEGPDGVRRYGPLDPWAEAAPDPRAGYHAVGTALVRRAEAGRDYDERRHVTGLPDARRAEAAPAVVAFPLEARRAARS